MKRTPKLVKLKLLSIDAWRNPEGDWYWNNSRCLDDAWYWDTEYMTPRRILRELRENGFLSEYSKGLMTVVDGTYGGDGYCWEVRNKNTGEPVFVLSSVH